MTPPQIHENIPTFRNTIVNFQNKIKKALKESRKGGGGGKIINIGMKNQIKMRLVNEKSKCWETKG